MESRGGGKVRGVVRKKQRRGAGGGGKGARGGDQSSKSSKSSKSSRTKGVSSNNAATKDASAAMSRVEPLVLPVKVVDHGQPASTHVSTSTPKTSPPSLEHGEQQPQQQLQQQPQQQRKQTRQEQGEADQGMAHSTEQSSARSSRREGGSNREPRQSRAQQTHEADVAAADDDDFADGDHVTVGYDEDLGQLHPLKLSPAAAIVRRLEQEGRDARNLAAWSLPNDMALSTSAANGGENDGEARFRTRLSSRSQQRRSRNNSACASQDEDAVDSQRPGPCAGGRRKRGPSKGRTTGSTAQPASPHRRNDGSSHYAEASGDADTQGVSAKRRAFSRKSASAGTLPHTSADSDDQSVGSFNTSTTTTKGGLKARYWRYLFDNLNRAIDELYLTCEMDESSLECEEVIMILANAKRDFQALIQRFHVQASFEGAPPGLAPAVAWEIRKVTQPAPVARLTLDGDSCALAPEDLPRLASPPRRRTEGDSVRFAAADATQAYLEEAAEATHATSGGDESPSGLNRSLTSLDDSSYLYELESRPPGSGAILHHRLSSPSRKKSARVIEQELEERHRRAQLNRSQRQQELTRRLQQQHDKVVRVRGRREEREEQRKQDIEQRLWKAQRLRQSHLEEVRRRNRDEEIKTREVAFIQRLEEDARRREVLARIEDEEARLRRRELERRNKMEKNAQRQAAVQQRRQELDTQRRARLRERDEAWKRRVESLEKERPDRRRMSASGSLSRSTSRTRVSAVMSPTKPRGSEGDAQTAAAAQKRDNAESHSHGNGAGDHCRAGGGKGRALGDDDVEGGEGVADPAAHHASSGRQEEGAATGREQQQSGHQALAAAEEGRVDNQRSRPGQGNSVSARTQSERRGHKGSRRRDMQAEEKQQQQQQQRQQRQKYAGGTKPTRKAKREQHTGGKGSHELAKPAHDAQHHGNAQTSKRRPVSASYASRAATSDEACMQANAARQRRRRPRSSAGPASTRSTRGGADGDGGSHGRSTSKQRRGAAQAKAASATSTGAGGGGWQQPPRRHTCKPRTAVGLDVVSSAIGAVDVQSSGAGARSTKGVANVDDARSGGGRKPRHSPKTSKKGETSRRGKDKAKGKDKRDGRGSGQGKGRGANAESRKQDAVGEGSGVSKQGASLVRGNKTASRKEKRKGRKAAKKKGKEAMLDALVAHISTRSSSRANNNDVKGGNGNALEGGEPSDSASARVPHPVAPDPVTEKRRAELDERTAPIMRRAPFDASSLSRHSVFQRCTNRPLLALFHEVASAIADTDTDTDTQAAVSCVKQTARKLLHELDTLLPDTTTATSHQRASATATSAHPSDPQHQGRSLAAAAAPDIAVLLCAGAGVLLLHQRYRAHVPIAAVAGVVSMCSDRWTAWSKDLTKHATGEAGGGDAGSGNGEDVGLFGSSSKSGGNGCQNGDDPLSALFGLMGSAETDLWSGDGLPSLAAATTSGSTGGVDGASTTAPPGMKQDACDSERRKEKEAQRTETKAALLDCARAVVETGAAAVWAEALSLALRESQRSVGRGNGAGDTHAGASRSATPAQFSKQRKQQQLQKQGRKQKQRFRPKRREVHKDAGAVDVRKQQQQQQHQRDGVKKEGEGEEPSNPAAALASSSSSFLASLVEVLATTHGGYERSSGDDVRLLCDLQELILSTDVMHMCRSWADALSHPIQVDVFSALCSLTTLVSSLVRHDATDDGWARRLYTESSCAGHLPLLSVCTPPQQPSRQTQPANVRRAQQQQEQQSEPRQALFMLLAYHVLRALASLAATDGRAFVTATSGREAWPSLVYTLAHVFREAHNTSRQDAAVVAALHCVAWLCRLQPDHKQRMLGLGASATLPLICNLPIRFFTSANTYAADALFVAIASVCVDHEAATKALMQELSPVLVVEHLQRKQQQQHAKQEEGSSVTDLLHAELSSVELQHAIEYFELWS